MKICTPSICKQQPSQTPHTYTHTDCTAQHVTYIAAGRLWVVQHVLCELHLLALRLCFSTPAAAVLAGLACTTSTNLAVILLLADCKHHGRAQHSMMMMLVSDDANTWQQHKGFLTATCVGVLCSLCEPASLAVCNCIHLLTQKKT